MRKEKIIHEIYCDNCQKDLTKEILFYSDYDINKHSLDFCIDCFNNIHKELVEKYRDLAKSLNNRQFMVSQEVYIQVNNTLHYLDKRIDIYFSNLIDNDDIDKQVYIFFVRDSSTNNIIENNIRVFTLESLETNNFDNFIRKILLEYFSNYLKQERYKG